MYCKALCVREQSLPTVSLSGGKKPHFLQGIFKAIFEGCLTVNLGSSLWSQLDSVLILVSKEKHC